METEENDMEFLDLDDDTPVETLPETTPFAAPRPRKPWFLMGLGVVVIILATYIIVRTIGGDSSRSVEINLDAPVVDVEPQPVDVSMPNDTLNVPAQPVAVNPAPMPTPNPAAAPALKPAPQPVVENNGVPVRVVSDRRDVTFNPERPATEPAPVVEPKTVAKPQPKPTTEIKPSAKPAPKPATKTQTKVATTPSGKWFVQFGSYTTRAAAESAERQLRAGHKSLFDGKQFVILAAQLPNGKTTYRLRISFATSADAHGFCQNAKSDGLDCYVAK